MARVTVVVPAYNYARFLPHALDSVLAQTWRDWECVVVDDGSTDDTAAVAGQYAARDPRFRVIRQANAGLAAARNTGLRHAAGELIQFLDADDRLEPEKLERHTGHLDAHQEVDVVYSEAGFFRTEAPDQLMPSIGGKLSRSIMARISASEDPLRTLEHYNIMPVQAALVRRSAAERAGPFDENAPSCEDWGFWIRCAATGARFEFVDSPAPLSAVRAHGTSMSRDFTRMSRGLIAIAKAFETSPARARLAARPLIYDVALGYEAVAGGARRRGAAQIWRAAGRATEPLTGLRWRLYAIAALVLPHGAYLRFVGHPVPEWPFELYRRARRFFRR